MSAMEEIHGKRVLALPTSFVPLPNTSDICTTATEWQEERRFDSLISCSQSETSVPQSVRPKTQSLDLPRDSEYPVASDQLIPVQNNSLHHSSQILAPFLISSSQSVIESINDLSKAPVDLNREECAEATGSTRTVTIIRDFAFNPSQVPLDATKTISRSSTAPLPHSKSITHSEVPSPNISTSLPLDPIVINDKENRSIRRPVLRTQSLSSIISLSPSHIPQRLSSLRSRLSSSSVSSTGSTSSVRLPRYLGSHRSAQAVLPLQRSISFGSFGELQSPAFQAYQYRTFSFVSANSPKRSSSLPIIREYRRTEQDRLYLDIDSIYNELHFPDRARQPQVYPGQSSTRQKIPIYVPMSFSGNRRSKMHTSKMAHQGSRDEQDRLIDSSRQQQEKKKKAQKKLAQKSLKSTTVPMRRVPNVNEPRPKTLWTKFKDLFTKKAK